MMITQSWTCICSLGFCMNNSRNWGPFIIILVLGRMKYRPAAPWNDIVPQIIWLGGCLIVVTTYFLPAVHVARYKLLSGAFVRNQNHIPLSESPMAMTSGKVQSVFRHHWCQIWLLCRSVGLQSKFETVLKRIAVPFKCKIA